MKRTTPRTPTPYRELYKKYSETQMTLEELLTEFQDYTIYGTLDNAEIHIVNADNKEHLLFESIGYEDEDCIPTIYEVSPYVKQGTDFNEVANIYHNNCFAITKLN